MNGFVELLDRIAAVKISLTVAASKRRAIALEMLRKGGHTGQVQRSCLWR
jgi:hypothetical protein